MLVLVENVVPPATPVLIVRVTVTSENPPARTGVAPEGLVLIVPTPLFGLIVDEAVYDCVAASAFWTHMYAFVVEGEPTLPHVIDAVSA